MKVITLVGLVLLCSAGMALAQSQIKKDDATKKSHAAAVKPVQQQSVAPHPSAVKEENVHSEHRTASMQHTGKGKHEGMEPSARAGETKSESLKTAMKHGHRDTDGVTVVAHGGSASHKPHKPVKK